MSGLDLWYLDRLYFHVYLEYIENAHSIYCADMVTLSVVRYFIDRILQFFECASKRYWNHDVLGYRSDGYALLG